MLQNEEDQLRRSLDLPAARSVPVAPPQPQPSPPLARLSVRKFAATKEPTASAELPARVLPATLPLRPSSKMPRRTTTPDRPPAPTPQSEGIPPPRAAEHPVSRKGGKAAEKSNEAVDSPTLSMSSDDGGLGSLLLPGSPTGSAGDASGLSGASDDEDGFDLDNILMSDASGGRGADGGGSGLVNPQMASLAQQSAAGNGGRGPQSGDRRVGDRSRGGGGGKGRGGRGKGGIPRGGATGRRRGVEKGKGMPTTASSNKAKAKKPATKYTQLGQGVEVKFRGGNATGTSRQGSGSRGGQRGVTSPRGQGVGTLGGGRI